MNFKTGYKQTEIGVIPEDWEVKTIKEISNPVRGGSPRPAGSPKYFNGDYIPWLTVAALTNISESQIFVSETEGYLTKEGSLHSRTLEKETLIIANSGATLGVAKLLAIKCCANDGIAALFDVDKNAEKRFVVYYINSLTKKLRTVIATGNGQPNLNTDLIGNIAIPFPPLPEQTAIAAALSDVDALMGELDKLIAKKRDIKQATMQQLLTGKKRLAGFSGEWEVKLCPEVCWFQEGPGVRASQFTRSGVKLLNGTNIENGKLILDKTTRYISEKEAFGWYAHFLVDDGDIIIACSGITIDKFHEKVTFVTAENLPLCMNTSTMRFKVLSKSLVKDYLAHFLKSQSFKQQIGGSATGSAQLNFGPSHVQNVQINIPPIEEQTAIATILSDMDAEINALQQKRDKTSQLKQGMMQELLTGRIRLIIVND